MEIKILQVFLGADGLPYKDQERTVHFPIVGSGFQGASNTTKIRFYYDELVEQDDTETAWVACAKLPNGKIGSKVLETDYDSTLGEHYALLELDSFYFQYKGDVYISLQGYQGGVQVSYDEETELYTIYGTPTIAATGSIKLSVNYATQFVGSGETSNVNFQRILADLGTKLGIRATSVFVEELPTVGNPDTFYVIHNDLSDPNKANIYIWNSVTEHYICVGDNTLDLGNYYTTEQGEQFEEQIVNRVASVENELSSVAQGSPKGVYATLADLQAAYPTGTTGIYIVSANGHWYYWNGSAWTDGGVYLSSAADLVFNLYGTNAIANRNVATTLKTTIFDALKNHSFFGNGTFATYGTPNFSILARVCTLRYVKADKIMRFVASTGYQILLVVSSDGTDANITRSYSFEDTYDRIVYEGEYFKLVIRKYPEDLTQQLDIFEATNSCYVISEPEQKIANNKNANVSFVNIPSFNYNGYIASNSNPYSPAGSFVTVYDTSYQCTDLIPLEKDKTYIIYACGTVNTAVASIWVDRGLDTTTYGKLYEWVENVVEDTSGGADAAKFFEYTPTQNVFIRICNRNATLPSNKVRIFEKNEDFEFLMQYANENISDLENKKINVIGDSYVAGDGTQGSAGIPSTWHYKMSQKYNMTYNNYGISGNGLICPAATGTPVVSRYQNMTNDADIVVVIGGKNDYNQQYPIADFKAGLKTLCEGLIAKYPTKRIVFFTPWRVSMETLISCDPSQSGFTIPLVDYCDAIVEVCKEYMIPVFNTKNSQMFINNSTFRTTYMQSSTDVSHTNYAGASRFEEIAEKWLTLNL